MDRTEFSQPMFDRLAELLAEDYLDRVNQISESVNPSQNIYKKYVKRTIDIIVSSIALAVTSPINLVLAVGTYFDVGSPILFKQKRLGVNGEEFTIVKFRNMTNETDENGNLLPANQRVTKWGRVVRKTSLDELLNFWSILKGDMSLIGPRPLLPQYMARYSERHKGRMLLKPGLECPPHEELDHVWSWEEQFENDVWYVEHLSFSTDCLMTIRLVQMVFNRKSSAARGGANRRGFMGYSDEAKAIGLMEVPQKYIDQVMNEFAGIEGTKSVCEEVEEKSEKIPVGL